MVERFDNQYFEEAIYRWKTSIKRANAFKQSVNPEQYFEVRYEELVQNPEKVLKQVCNFHGTEFHPEMLEYWMNPSTIENKYYKFHANLGKPVFSSSIGKWKERLTKEQQTYVLDNISRDLRVLGYLE
jgi:hypothetical protein